MSIQQIDPQTPAEQPATLDVAIRDEGSIVLFDLRTDEARAWWDEHVADGMRFAGCPVVEHRYADAIIDGLLMDGLVVS